MNIKLNHFKQAIENLEEVLKENKTDIVRDSAIKRYEICYELAWKTVQEKLKNQGLEVCRSPKECFKQAFYQEWIDNELLFSDMIKNRNLTTHTYDSELAENVYLDIKNYLPLFKELLQKIDNE
jgi:nucleotidyltransferase substrate binding protein (TIGR01987 family)